MYRDTVQPREVTDVQRLSNLERSQIYRDTVHPTSGHRCTETLSTLPAVTDLQRHCPPYQRSQIYRDTVHPTSGHRFTETLSTLPAVTDVTETLSNLPAVTDLETLSNLPAVTDVQRHCPTYQRSQMYRDTVQPSTEVTDVQRHCPT